jgi:hypothetical protein
MSSDRDYASMLEVTPGDVTIGSDGKVEIINVRLAEIIKAAVRLQKEHGDATIGRHTNINCAGCPGANIYHCEPSDA